MPCDGRLYVLSNRSSLRSRSGPRKLTKSAEIRLRESAITWQFTLDFPSRDHW